MSAPITGITGQVDFAGIVDSDVVYRVHAWSLDVTGDTHDVTDFASAGWREHVAGLKGWTASLEMYVDDTNQIVPSDVGSNATIKLYLNTTDYYHGKGIVNGHSPATTIDGIATQSLSVQGTSDLFYTES